jgi:hypothetical protein
MPTRLPHCGGRSMDLRQPGGQQQLRDTRSGSMPANSAPMRKHQSRGWNGSNRVGGITTVFREHYSSWVPTGVRRVRRGQLRPRDSRCRIGSRHRVPSGMQSTTNPSPRRRWNAQSRTCRHTKLATLLKSELIKAGGSALVKLLLKLVNWVWELETLPTAWSQDR